MSFFTKGFAGSKNNKAGGSKTTTKDKKKAKKDEGRWDMLTDAYGRTYWQHSITGEWSYVHRGGALVSPAVTVTPSPMGYAAAGPAVFTPSPVPPAYVLSGPWAHTNVRGNSATGGGKKKGTGSWEPVYADDGSKHWVHTATKKKTYKDPYY